MRSDMRPRIPLNNSTDRLGTRSELQGKASDGVPFHAKIPNLYYFMFSKPFTGLIWSSHYKAVCLFKKTELSHDLTSNTADQLPQGVEE